MFPKKSLNLKMMCYEVKSTSYVFQVPAFVFLILKHVRVIDCISVLHFIFLIFILNFKQKESYFPCFKDSIAVKQFINNYNSFFPLFTKTTSMNYVW